MLVSRVICQTNWNTKFFVVFQSMRITGTLYSSFPAGRAKGGSSMEGILFSECVCVYYCTPGTSK
jgi:hypothetical protein